MSARDQSDHLLLDAAVPPAGWESTVGLRAAGGLATGELVALVDGGRCPLVNFDARPAAVPARSLVDLHARHIGCQVALLFLEGDIAQPVIVGLLQDTCSGWPLGDPPAHVEVEAGGERMLLSARRELVLRCGKASITLNADGHVVIRGESVTTQAVGANRVRGGSVELN